MGQILTYVEGGQILIMLLLTLQNNQSLTTILTWKQLTTHALEAVWTLISRTNKYIDETAPWVLAKDETLQTNWQVL